MSERHDGDSSARPEERGRRTSATIFTVLLVCAVVLAGATGLSAILTRSARHATVRTPATTCTAPDAPPSAIPANEIGAWRYNVVETGTFGSVVAASSSVLYAIQACGAQESSLRVIRLQPGSKQVAVSKAFDHAAFLTSSLVLAHGSLYFGAARLDLAGSATAPPYELTLYRLSPSSLAVLGSRALGRGYGLSLYQIQGGVIASTGGALVRIDPSSLAPRTIISFGDSVAQHVAASGLSPYVAVSLFSPAATPPAETARIELLELATGEVVSSIGLPSGSDPESLAIVSGDLWASIGSGLSTQVERYTLPGLAVGGSKGGTTVPTALQSISLNTSAVAGRTVVWLHGLTLVACANPSTGAVLAWTSQTATPPASVSEIVAAGSQDYAVTSTAIGILAVPRACSART